MKSQSLTSQLQIIKWLIAEAGKLDASQNELRAHWARYICVLSSGFLENAVKDIYSRYARGCSPPAIGDYVSSALARIQNPKSGRFLEVAVAFNKDWADELTNFLEDEGRGDAIDAIMSNRHLIAHGKNSNISLARITEYLNKSVKVIDYIEEQCGL
jgi:hypothetical protein